MKLHSLFFTILLLLGASNVEAFFPDLVDVQAQYVPYTVADTSGLEAQVASYDAVINVPLVLNQKTFLIPGIAYHIDSIAYDREPEDFTSIRSLQSIEIPVLFVRLLPDDWSFSVRIAAGLAGDFEGFDTGLLRGMALGMVTKAFGDQFVLGVGAMASYAFGALLPLPAIYLDWTPASWFRAEAFVPGFTKVSWMPIERLELGIRADLSGNEYAIRNPEAGNDLDHIAHSLATVGVHGGVRLFSSVWLTVSGGRVVWRRVEQFDDENQTLVGGSQGLPGDWFARAGLTFRIPQ